MDDAKLKLVEKIIWFPCAIFLSLLVVFVPVFWCIKVIKKLRRI
jgi:hypothetical protein